ncbi:hypothetical protein TIFTF001_029834 [Ficus carica]|uniref:Uncharacterized protein n=1 Tax=Ficus carica TaxID=3494 RepID=A0AA88IYQ0_FICCA|nr:hypothetical protein TIFTF001_029834 [Ficus carica]
MLKMFRIDIGKQVSAGSSPLTLVSDCISRAIRAEYWINQERARLVTLPKIPNSSGGTEGEGILLVWAKRRTTVEMRVMIMTIQCALNVDGSTWECADLD